MIARCLGCNIRIKVEPGKHPHNCRSCQRKMIDEALAKIKEHEGMIADLIDARSGRIQAATDAIADCMEQSGIIVHGEMVGEISRILKEFF